MRLLNSNATLLLFGVAIILNSFTTMVLLQRVFGDSTTPKQNVTMHLSTPKAGDPVNIQDTTPYSAMQLNLNPLMQCLMNLS